MNLMELFSNPETIHSLSFSEKMLGSFITMVMGMGITFLVLIIIWAFIAVLGKALQESDKSTNSEAPGGIDDKIIAAGMAAVLYYEDTLASTASSRINGLGRESTTRKIFNGKAADAKMQLHKSDAQAEHRYYDKSARPVVSAAPVRRYETCLKR